MIQLEFCNPQSQRLADLYGHQYDLNNAIRFCDLHIEIDPTEAGISIEEFCAESTPAMHCAEQRLRAMAVALAAE